MSRIDAAQATEIALAHIRAMDDGEELRSLGGLCIGWSTERPYGWVFAVTTRTGSPIVGSTVFLVDPTEGSILNLPTALPISHILAAWDAAHAEGRAFDPWTFIRDPRNHPR